MSANNPTMIYDSRLTGIVGAVHNKNFIADDIFPSVEVATLLFRYRKMDLQNFFQLYQTRVARKSRLNEIDFTGQELTDSILDDGLMSIVPNDDIQNQPDGFDILGMTAAGVMELVLLKKEKEAADIVFNNASYLPGNITALGAADQWSNYTSASSDPVEDIMLALESCLIRPNTGILGRRTWAKTRIHPKVVDFINGKGGTKGQVSKEQFAEAFELDRILVGESFQNIANPVAVGESFSSSRLWGPHAAFINVQKPSTTNAETATFGFTAELTGQARVAGSNPMPAGEVGLTGGTQVFAGTRNKRILLHKELGCYFPNCIVT